GGESGIGRACAVALGRGGTGVTLTYHRDEAAAAQVVAEIEQAGGRALARHTDITDEAQVEVLFTAAEEAFGPVRRLGNSAGLNMSGVPIAQMELAQFDRVLRADLYGPFLTCRRFVRGLLKAGQHGRIVNISSIHESAPRPGGVEYDSAKGGLAQLTATLA